ncbi:hypothetical protein D3C76_1043850 [compost metagenome]
MQQDLLTPLGDTRGFGQAEQLLQAHGEDRWRFAVVQADVRPRRHAQVHRRPFIQTLRQRPGQQIAQHRRQVELGKMAQAGNLAQVGLQPIRQACQQSLVAQVRPFACTVGCQIKLAQQGNPRLPLTQLGRP